MSKDSRVPFPLMLKERAFVPLTSSSSVGPFEKAMLRPDGLEGETVGRFVKVVCGGEGPVEGNGTKAQSIKALSQTASVPRPMCSAHPRTAFNSPLFAAHNQASLPCLRPLPLRSSSVSSHLSWRWVQVLCML